MYIRVKILTGGTAFKGVIQLSTVPLMLMDVMAVLQGWEWCGIKLNIFDSVVLLMILLVIFKEERMDNDWKTILIAITILTNLLVK